ncbi:23S rRNA (uracil(1939)-C(5))-methyltransferase RlmD [Desulfallas thermosapovorans]|uniref:23S rRNA m(5)U-1939 methyltransferase n=1 Tax=Desulfallas thermosapovorans DSM 6562 TaxID=1121431 RepID=A0A5S4ZNB6_9FIRM|nr:23S rRNA (uracil(1939)-C(5))-methyltransferase RlmD [Desulfallas thermosapovorans]TYO92321.1 23S rRNA m(5)U-1939 methyltransferase [Desulfallas thermosapovorans DSM 6562]
MQKGQAVTLQITDINRYGEGIGRADDGMVVFVPGAVTGERVTVRIEELRKRFARGKLLETVIPSEYRVAPACGLAEYCGGCHLQHLAYAEQLRWKTDLVRQNLSRIGGIDGGVVRDIIGMTEPWHYRNNVRFKVQRRGGKVALGFFAAESHRLVAGLDSRSGTMCLLAHRELNRAAEGVREVLEKSPAVAVLPEEIMLRRGSTGQIMVVLIGKPAGAERKRYLAGLAGELTTVPGVVTVVDYARAAGNKTGGRYKILAGPGYIEDELDGLCFRISAASFYQVNPSQTTVLYKQALEYCALQGHEEVADAYCGVGTIALYIARYTKAVRGYEVVPGAVQDAEANAALNGVKNTRFFAGAVERMLVEHVASGYNPEVVVLDPPRSGCRSEVLEALAQSGTRRVVYVSCDPATLARDVGYLHQLGFVLQEVQPVDMFPHTGHVECVTLMSNSIK